MSSIESKPYRRYFYKGTVYGSFDKILETDWMGETIAPTKKKALSNLMYQFRRERGLYPRTLIYLDAKSLTCDDNVRAVDILLPELVKKEPEYEQLKLWS